MSERLNSYNRMVILKKIIKYRFEREFNSHVKKHNMIAERIYHDVYGDNVKKFYELPEGWMPEAHSIYVKLGHDYQYMYFALGKAFYHNSHLILRAEYDTKTSKRVPAKKVHSILKVYDAAHEATKEYEKWLAEDKDLAERMENAAAKAYAVLTSVTTMKRLIEVWPDVEPFCTVEAKKVYLPAVNTTELATIFDLPVTEKAV